MADSTRTLVLVHTVPLLVETFDHLGKKILPGVRFKHVVDEPMLERIRDRGHLSPQDAARLQTHVELAHEIHAGAVLVTCSTVSPCVNELPSQNSIPVIKIDQAMLARAVGAGARVGVVATVTTTLEPTQQALVAEAEGRGKTIETQMVFVPDAFAALSGGDGARHDSLVKQVVLDLAPGVDAIVLAQASMGRVLEVFAPDECRVPILTSPETALRHVQDLMQWH